MRKKREDELRKTEERLQQQKELKLTSALFPSPNASPMLSPRKEENLPQKKKQEEEEKKEERRRRKKEIIYSIIII